MDWSGEASADTSQHKSLIDVAVKTNNNLARDFYDPTVIGERQSPLIPIFHGDEIVISKDPVLWSHHTADHALRTIRIVMDLQLGSFGKGMEHVRNRFADRSIDGHYVVRTLQPPLTEDSVVDFVTEIYMLTEVSPKHPNILQAYGMQKAEESLLLLGRKGSFVITDCIVEMLPDRIDSWRRSSKGLHDRLEIAMDVTSALVYLHSRKIVYHLTPSKVGFDSRYGRIKLCQFGHARHERSTDFPKSLQKSDDVRRVLLYAAPEVYSSVISLKSDVYALAMLLWEMVTLKIPFRRCSSRAELYYRTVKQHQRPDLDPYYWPASLMELVISAWDSANRPTIKVLYQGLETALLYSGEDNDNAKQDYARTRCGMSEHDSKGSSFVSVGTSGVFGSVEEGNEDEIYEGRRESISRTRSAGDPPSTRPPPLRTHSADGTFRTPAPRRKKISARVSPAPQSASAAEDRKLKLTRSPDSSKMRDDTTAIFSQSSGSNLKTPRAQRSSRKLTAADMRTPGGRSKDIIDNGSTPHRSPASGRSKERSETEHMPRRSASHRSNHDGINLNRMKATRRASEDLSGFKFEETLFKASTKAPRRRSEFYNTSSNDGTPTGRRKSPIRSSGKAFSERDIFENHLSSRDHVEKPTKTPRNRRPSGSHIAALTRSKSPSKSPGNEKSGRQAQRSRSFSNQPSITPNPRSSGDLKSMLSDGSSDKAKMISDASLAKAVGNLRL